MFGFTKLSPEEKIVHERKKRIEELTAELNKESGIRTASLERASSYQKELDVLSKDFK